MLSTTFPAFRLADAKDILSPRMFGRAIVAKGDRVRVATGSIMTDANFSGPVIAEVIGLTGSTVDMDEAVLDLIDGYTGENAVVSTRKLTVLTANMMESF